MVKKYGELYLNARKALRPIEGDNAAVYARELLALASGKSVASLLADRELYASEAIEDALNGYLSRVLAGEPLAYILGEWSFYGLPLTVTPDVLIPRDDTMAVTDLAIEAARDYPAPQRVLDLCTGSGCIGLAVAYKVESARVTLADISDKALRVARQNMTRLHLKHRVTAFSVDVLQPAAKFLGQFDVIVSNPPYITTKEMTELPARMVWIFTAQFLRILTRRCGPAARSASSSVCRSRTLSGGFWSRRALTRSTSEKICAALPEPFRRESRKFEIFKIISNNCLIYVMACDIL